MIGTMAISARVIEPGSALNNTSEIYSLPTNATPAMEAALEIRIIQLMEKATEGW